MDADFVVENSYANISRAVLRDGFSQIDVTGQFSLGYPRKDGGEEIDARVRVSNRTVADFLGAFDLEDYDVQGLVSGDFHLYGQYTQPFGFGRLAIRQGTAYGEPFAEGEAALRFEGAGVRLDGLHGAEGRHDRHRRRLHRLERRLLVQRRRPRHGGGDAGAWRRCRAVPSFTGLFDFSANGSGTFNQPRYDVKFGVRDLFYGDEGVGEVSGRMSVQGTVLVYEMEVASTRLAASGTGRIALDRRDGRGAVVPHHRHVARSRTCARSSRSSRRSRRRLRAARSAWSASSTTRTRCASTWTSKTSPCASSTTS